MNKKNNQKPVGIPKNRIIAPKPQPIEVTLDNAPKLTVKYLEQIFMRLGYLIKIIEAKENK